MLTTFTLPRRYASPPPLRSASPGTPGTPKTPGTPEGPLIRPALVSLAQARDTMSREKKAFHRGIGADHRLIRQSIESNLELASRTNSDATAVGSPWYSSGTPASLPSLPQLTPVPEYTDPQSSGEDNLSDEGSTPKKRRVEF